MSGLADDVNEIEMPKLPPAGLVAAGLVGAVVAVGIVGWLIFRNRRRHPMVQRLQDAVPESVREIPEGVRTQVSRVLPLRRPRRRSG